MIWAMLDDESFRDFMYATDDLHVYAGRVVSLRIDVSIWDVTIDADAWLQGFKEVA